MCARPLAPDTLPATKTIPTAAPRSAVRPRLKSHGHVVLTVRGGSQISSYTIRTNGKESAISLDSERQREAHENHGVFEQPGEPAALPHCSIEPESHIE